MIYAALSIVLLYALVSVLRARSHYLEWEKFWASERGALKALASISGDLGMPVSDSQEKPCSV